MDLSSKTIGFAMCGSHCTLEEVIPEVARLVKEGATVIPIISESVANTDTRFGSAQKWKDELLRLTGRKPLSTIVEVEPIGPKKLLDIMVVAPCTGNTMAKIANAITDSTVTMAVKAHLRNDRPVVLAISTNDALGNNARNLGVLLATKNVFFVPFGQDNPQGKPKSLVARLDLLKVTILEALSGKQIQPLLLGYNPVA